MQNKLKKKQTGTTLTKPTKSLINRKFGRLTVVKVSGKYRKKDWIYTCRCDCGNIENVRSSSLTSGNTKSCGCIHKEFLLELSKKNIGNTYRKKHGLRNSCLYSRWLNLRNRCNNKKYKSFHRYGGRGIKVCSRWDNYELFYSDMYESYMKHKSKHGNKNTTIDRINNDGNYEPDNCRWATMKQQANNTCKTNK